MSNKKPFISKVATGNALIKGDCLFLSADGNWTPNVRSALVATNKEDADALLAQAQIGEAKNEIVDIYLVDVDVDEKGAFPRHIRERIRVDGPTVEFLPSDTKKEQVA